MTFVSSDHQDSRTGMPEYLKLERAARDSYAMDLEELQTPYLIEAEWSLLNRGLEQFSGMVLEAGCGTGRVASRLAAAGVRVVGIDLSGASLLKFRTRRLMKNISLAQGELTTMPIRSQAFERVYCVQVIPSLLEFADVLAALKELARVVRRPGTVLLTAWNYHLADRLKRTKTQQGAGADLHYRKFEPGELYALLRRAFPTADLDVWTSVHFHRKPLKLVARLFDRLPAQVLALDRLLERTPFSRYLGHLVCARATFPPTR